MPKKEISFSSGDVIFRQGEPCRHVYTILEGRVEMFYEINGQTRVLGRKSEDDVLGANSVLEGTYDTSARAATNVVLAEQTAEEYIAQLQRSGELSPSFKGENVNAGAAAEEEEDGDFSFDFGSSFGADDEEEEESGTPAKSGRRRSSALSFGMEDEEEEKKSPKALVKVEKPASPPVTVKPRILPADIRKSPLTEWLMESREEPVSFGPAVLLASFVGDDDGRLRDVVYETLRQIPNLQVKAVGAAVRDENVGRAALQMRSWMKQHEADVGLYARLDNAGRILEFHTVKTPVPGDAAGPGMRFFLPVEMKPEHRTLLKIFTAAAVVPTRLEHEQLLRLFLPVVLSEAAVFGAAPMPGLRAEEQAANLTCFASALSLAGLFRPKENTHARAAEVYEKALALMPSYAPEYVFVNRQVGLIHQILGEKKEDVQALKKAEDIFSRAVEAVSAVHQPEAWGDLKIRIGNVRQKIAAFTGGGDDFALAMNAYRDALGVLKASVNTEKWADAMNGLARTMQLFGTHSAKTTLLEKSIGLYEKELAVLNRDMFPMAWASASNNLASALFLLFDKKNDPALLRRAVEVFSDALTVYDKTGARKMAAVATNNLRRAEKALSETENELEQKKNWLDDLLDNAEDGSVPMGDDGDEPLVFEKIAVFEELDDDE